jgi:hypothetical protein
MKKKCLICNFNEGVEYELNDGENVHLCDECVSGIISQRLKNYPIPKVETKKSRSENCKHEIETSKKITPNEKDFQGKNAITGVYRIRSSSKIKYGMGFQKGTKRFRKTFNTWLEAVTERLKLENEFCEGKAPQRGLFELFGIK